MKRTALGLALAFVLVFAAAAQAEWIVYDASALPTDLGFLPDDITDKNTHHELFSLIDDPDTPGNKLLVIKDDRDDYKEFWAYNWEASPEVGATIIFRVKALEPAADYSEVFDIRFSNGAFEDGLTGASEFFWLQRAGDSWIADLSGWVVFRITFQNDKVNVYVNEDDFAVIEGTTTRKEEKNAVRFGAKSTGGTLGGVFDWLIFSTEGAFAPGQGPALPELTGL